MNTYKTTPNIPEDLNSHGREHFRLLSKQKLSQSQLTEWDKHQISIASFMYQRLKELEKGNDLTTYLKLSEELRKVQDKLFEDD